MSRGHSSLLVAVCWSRVVASLVLSLHARLEEPVDWVIDCFALLCFGWLNWQATRVGRLLLYTIYIYTIRPTTMCFFFIPVGGWLVDTARE